MISDEEIERAAEEFIETVGIVDAPAPWAQHGFVEGARWALSQCQAIEWKRPESSEADMPEMWGPMIVRYLDDYGADDAYWTMVVEDGQRVPWRQQGGKLVAYAVLPLPDWLEGGK